MDTHRVAGDKIYARKISPEELKLFFGANIYIRQIEKNAKTRLVDAKYFSPLVKGDKNTFGITHLSEIRHIIRHPRGVIAVLTDPCQIFLPPMEIKIKPHAKTVLLNLKEILRGYAK